MPDNENFLSTNAPQCTPWNKGKLIGAGVAPFVDYFEGYFRERPKSHVVFSHIVAEADLVVLHQNSKVDEKDRGRATVDIFRVKNGKIVEHWDVTQDVPEKTASGNTMF